MNFEKLKACCDNPNRFKIPNGISDTVQLFCSSCKKSVYNTYIKDYSKGIGYTIEEIDDILIDKWNIGEQS